MKPESFLKPLTDGRILLGIVFFAVIAIRFSLFFGVDKSLWLDEAALAINILDKGFGEFFSPLIYSQAAPPLFLILTKLLTVVFGAGEKVLRFIPFLCGLLSIFAFYFLLKEVFKKCPRIAYFGTFIFSFGFSFLYNSIEFKPYTTDVLFTILVFLIWLKIFSNNNISADDSKNYKKENIFVFLFSLFPLFSFGSIFSLSAVWVLLFFRKNKIPFLILTISFILEYFFVFSNLNSATSVYQYWLPYFINFSLLKCGTTFLEILRYHLFPSCFANFACIFFVFGIFCLYKKNRGVFTISLLTIISGLCASFLNLYPLYGRLSLFLYPVILLVILSPLCFSVFSGWKNKCVLTIVFIFILSTVFYNPFVPALYKRKEIKPHLSYLKDNIKPKDKIFVYKNAHVTFLYYNKMYDFKNETYICAFNKGDNDCINEMNRFCDSTPAGNSCYILYSSEINAGQNIKTLNKIINNAGGKIIKTDVNSVLYEMVK